MAGPDQTISRQNTGPVASCGRAVGALHTSTKTTGRELGSLYLTDVLAVPRTHINMTLSIFVPIAYIAALYLSLALFSKIYRRRAQRTMQKYQNTSSQDAGTQPARAIYKALSEIQEAYPDEPAESEEWIVPRETLQASLLARAVAVLRIMSRLRLDKQALQSLLESGSLGDDAATMLEAKETEIRDEAFQIVREANRFHPSWGRLIFENANQISSNLNHRDILLNISKQRTDEQAKMRQMGMNVPELKFNIKPVAAPTS